MAASSLSGPYGAHQRLQSGLAHTHSPQPPPSPPMDEPRCSLPSISNLLGIADAGSPTSEHSPASQGQSPSTDAFHQGSYFKTHSRPGSGYAKSHQHQRGLPPTPPMSTDASFGTRSPATKSSVPTGFYYETTPPLEADHRRHAPPTEPARAPAPPSAPYSHQPLPPPSYLDQPPSGTYYQNVPPPVQPQVTSLYYQRPLPQGPFPPPSLPVPAAMSPSSGPNPWQHHHYLSPSHGAAFPQSQDRYICSTCNKAFSRPSSLRIHSHSHTGEKPFKCPHAGCGKAFSVRSNMKRHERGCHSFEVTTGGSALAA